MSARRRALVLAVALFAALLLAAPVAARTPTKTFTTKIFVSEKFPAFHGALHSKSSFCVAERPLKVYRLAHGRSVLLGHRRSNPDGTWKVPIGNKLVSGAYYVEAPLYGSAALGISCKPARSKIVPVD